VSKDTLDVNCARGQRKQARTFENNPDGWKRLLSWLKAMGGKQAHVCMEATGRHSLGIALALHDAGHVVSVINPAQIRDFARTKLGRNKTDKVDAALIREYAALFKPGRWTPPSPAMRRLCELQTVRAGIVKNRTEWKNRIGTTGAPSDRLTWIGADRNAANRVIRGGSWVGHARVVRAACRNGNDPPHQRDGIGSRCARVN
jgi:transposase